MQSHRIRHISRLVLKEAIIPATAARSEKNKTSKLFDYSVTVKLYACVVFSTDIEKSAVLEAAIF